MNEFQVVVTVSDEKGMTIDSKVSRTTTLSVLTSASAMIAEEVLLEEIQALQAQKETAQTEE